VLDRFKIQDNTAKLAATFRQVSQSHLRVRPAVSSSWQFWPPWMLLSPELSQSTIGFFRPM